MHIHGHGTGFTLLELLVTLTIAALLLTAGVPSLQQFTQRQHMKAAVGSLHNDLLLARSEAVVRNLEVVACPGAPRDGCTDLSDWSRGWIVFGDENGDRRRQGSETVLRHGQGFEHVRISSSTGLDSRAHRRGCSKLWPAVRCFHGGLCRAGDQTALGLPFTATGAVCE